MNLAELTTLLQDVDVEGYFLDVSESHGRIYLQASYLEADIVTGAKEEQFTRKWLLSDKMTKSEVVQTAFKCVLTSYEHRAREAFKYRGRRVFGPHFDVEALWGICTDRNLDYRRNHALV